MAATMQLKNRVIRDIARAIPAVLIGSRLHDNILLLIFKHCDGGRAAGMGCAWRRLREADHAEEALAVS